MDSPDLPDRAESEHAEATRRRTLACMDRLTPAERQIIEAVAVEGDSVIEAAARMGVPVGVAAAQLTTALRRLTVLHHEPGPRQRNNEHAQGRPL